MKDMGIIQGSKEQAVPLIIGKDTVYEHSEIEQVLKDHEGKSIDNLFKFREVQYGKDEYIKVMNERNKNTENTLDVLLTEIIPGLMSI